MRVNASGAKQHHHHTILYTNASNLLEYVCLVCARSGITETGSFLAPFYLITLVSSPMCSIFQWKTGKSGATRKKLQIAY